MAETQGNIGSALARKRALWARQFALLQQRIARLQELEADLIKVSGRLSRGDIAEKTAVLQERSRIANGFARGDRVSEAEIYDHLLANTERFCEETERAIGIVEKLLQQYHAAA